MNVIEKSELFEALSDLASRYPKWRIGQLICNVAGWADEEVWDIEDQRLLEAVRAHLSQVRRGSTETPAA
ncbi:MAG TPA: hypothetical protein VGI40_08905 [Pirellulaceae bacterium]|jgi:hypothetical protein